MFSHIFRSTKHTNKNLQNQHLESLKTPIVETNRITLTQKSKPHTQNHPIFPPNFGHSANPKNKINNSSTFGCQKIKTPTSLNNHTEPSNPKNQNPPNEIENQTNHFLNRSS
jgi:hypothetical protein